MVIYLASDHAGFGLKEELKTYLTGLGYEVEDLGNSVYAPDDDYPDFIRPVAEAVAKHDGSRGVVLGGSGEGEAIVANRFPQVRAVVWYGKSDEI